MNLKNKGFTLIESIIVMVILALSLSGATYLMITVTNSIAENRQRIKATYLTQECMELTRNARDSAWRQNSEWDCAFAPMTEGIELQISENPTVQAANATTNCKNDFGLKVQSSGSFQLKKRTDKLVDYNGTASNLIFNRKLVITEIQNNTDTPPKPISAKFTCEVTWENRGQPQKISMSQVLTDWKK